MDPFHETDDAFSGAAALQALRDRVTERARRHDAVPICLFLGAGADISSGGLTFGQFKRLALEDLLNERLFVATSEEAVDDGFDRLFSLNAPPGDRSLLIDRIFHQMESLQPSDAYKLLVLLGEAGAIDAIVTTNFDVMLETAESLLGSEVFQVFAAGVAKPFPVPSSSYTSPKKPYVKLHGDLASRAVSHVTAAELRAGNYDQSLIELLRKIAATHDMVFAGYSGQDEALASILADALAASSHSIFWCNPTQPSVTSPLRKQLSDRCRFIISKFDDLVEHIAEPTLRKPRTAAKKTSFIRCLFDWRVEHCNQTYFTTYGQRRGTSVIDLIAHRPMVERTVRTFLDSERSLAILAGPSGYGKTTIGLRLYDAWRNHPNRRTILLTAKSLAMPELEFQLAERLGGLGPAAQFSVASLETWLRETGTQLIVFVDGLNEYSTDLNECARLLRNIVRLCYYLPERQSAIRVLATIRQETWSSILPRLDTGALRQSLWSASDVADSIEAISIGPLTDEELKDALQRMRAHGKGDIRYEDLSPMAIERLRDPFLLSALGSSGHVTGLTGPTSSIFRLVYQAMLANNGAGADPATLEDSLARLALQALLSGNDAFRALDLKPAAIRGSLLRGAKDLGILVEADNGFLRFRHDRLQEYFLSIGLTLPDAPPLGTLEQLRDYLFRAAHNAKARAAARMLFAGDDGVRFRLIEEAILVATLTNVDLSSADREAIFSFAREVVYELTESNPVLAARYIRSGIRSARDGQFDIAHLRTLVQSAASLADETAVPALSMVVGAGNDLATTEAEIYATDKLLRRFLNDNCPDIDFLTTGPYETYFSATGLAPWRRAGRVCRLLTQAGPDNLYPTEYEAIKLASAPAFQSAFARTWNDDDIASFQRYLLANCDRLIFNATPEDIDEFFGNRDRIAFEAILDDLESGQTLQPRHLTVINPYIQSMDFALKPQNIEYNICNLFFVISGVNDLGATLDFWESRFASFNDATPAVEIDFYQGILVDLHVIFSLAYDIRFAEYEERILRDWPTVMKCKPGIARGLKRGFRDEFDMVFEDGFGVIYPYGILMPSRARRGQSYQDYRRSLEGNSRYYPLPLYSKYLRLYLNESRIDEAVQLIQALKGITLAWPLEGLATLRDAIGHADSTVHRAVVRVLAEAYNRHPRETVGFLRTSGSALGDDDLQQIKIRQDPRIGRTQVAIQEWARLAHYLLQMPSASRKLAACARVLLTASDLTGAVRKIAQELGLYDVTGR